MAAVRRVDPEPFTVVGAVAAVVAAAVTTLIAIKKHWPKLPSATRRRLMDDLSSVEEILRHLATDLEMIEGIFERAEFFRDRTLRLGKGALVSLEDFKRYQRVSDDVFGAFKRLNKLVLRIERTISRISWIEPRRLAEFRDESIDRLDRLLTARDLTVDEAWRDLRDVIDLHSKLASNLRSQVSSGL